MFGCLYTLGSDSGGGAKEEGGEWSPVDAMWDPVLRVGVGGFGRWFEYWGFVLGGTPRRHISNRCC